MTGLNFARAGMFAVAMLIVEAGGSGAQAQQLMKPGGILTGQLNAMLSRSKGKRVSTYQLVSEPRRLPPPSGLCNLTTGPETFQIVAANEAQTAQLHSLVGKQVSLKVSEVACAVDRDQWSEAVVTKWSLVKQ